MENIFINGDIYINTLISRQPTEATLTKAREMLSSSLNGSEEEEELYERYIDFVCEICENDENAEEVLYEFNRGFYQLFLGSEYPMLRNEKSKFTVYLRDMNELEKYLNLRDYIANAKYIGRYLEPTNINLPQYVVIYEYQDIWLIQDAKTGEFNVGHKASFGDYKIGRESETYEKLEVYQAIINQEMKHGFNRK